jgi:Uma2 family endonuclease
VTATEVERLHAQLARYEDAFPGYRMEIVEATIMMSPVRPHRGKTIRHVWNALEPQLSDDWDLVSDVTFVFDDENEFCPDLAVIPAAGADANRSAYDPDLIELVVEVVSPGSRRRDYEIKPPRYAARGIANYLVLDPYQGRCVAFWHPGPDGYQGRDTIPYGTEVKIDSPLGALTLDTDGLPKDPSAV